MNRMIKNVTLVRISPFGDSDHPHDLVPPFSIGYIATILNQKGFRIDIIDTLVEQNDEEGIIRLIKGYRPELVFIDCTSSANEILGKLSRSITLSNKAKIWCMGQYASALPEILLKENPLVEGCIIGEAEVTAVELIDCLNERKDPAKVKGIAFYSKKENKTIITEKREVIGNLDQLPSINYKLLKQDRYKVFSAHLPLFRKLRWGFLLSSRGCPYKCIYCSPTLRESYGSSFRASSARAVVNQMEELIVEYGVNAIAFQDENFTFDRERTINICDEIIRRNLNIKWVIQTRADCLDRQILAALKKAGCSYIGIGVESGSERILKILQKDETKDRIEASIKQAQAAGIFIIAFFMIGNPAEGPEDLIETFKFAKRLRPMMIQVAFFTAYPGSDSYKIFKKAEDVLGGLFHYDPIRFNFSRIPTEELIKFQKRFYLRYFLSCGYILKYLRHRTFYAIFNNGELPLLYRTFKYLFKIKK